MTTSSLSQTVDFWTAQAVMASGYLVRLYRALDDERQVAMAIQAGGPSEERAQRLGFQARFAALRAVFMTEQPEETIGEQRAWELLVEAQAGLCALHSLVDEHEGSGGLRGQRTSAQKALEKSMRGYRTACPEEMTTLGIRRAFEIAATRCSETFSLDMVGTTEDEKDDLRQELHTNIIDALMNQALHGQA